MGERLRNVKIRYGANLPHWTREGATYSVTFRLADSVPLEVLERWRKKREQLAVRSAPRELTEHELRRLAELHGERVENYLDAGCGACVLRDPRAAEIVAKAIRHFEGDRYTLLAWCVMPNHVHVVFSPKPGFELESILHSWKSFTATMINRALVREGVLWQAESFDHLIRDADELSRAIEYVLKNPERAGLGDWPWVGTK